MRDAAAVRETITKQTCDGKGQHEKHRRSDEQSIVVEAKSLNGQGRRWPEEVRQTRLWVACVAEYAVIVIQAKPGKAK